jgi:lambda repressor-like predicted transcriptional regulator
MEDVVIPDTIEAHPEEIWFENYLFISNDHLNPSPLI